MTPGIESRVDNLFIRRDSWRETHETLHALLVSKLEWYIYVYEFVSTEHAADLGLDTR